MICEKISATVQRYDGHQEIQPNLGFKDSIHASQLEMTGWKTGQKHSVTGLNLIRFIEPTES